MMRHHWSEAGEDGAVREFRAEHKAGRWRFLSRIKDGEDWEEADLSEPELRTLRELLWNKYQRRRIPWEHVRDIDRRLGEGEET